MLKYLLSYIIKNNDNILNETPDIENQLYE